MLQLNIVKTRRVWYTLSVILIAVSLCFLFFSGLKYGLDFTGGSLFEIEYSATRPSVDSVDKVLQSQNLKEYRVQSSGEKMYIIRTAELEENRHQEILKALEVDAQKVDSETVITEHRFESIGPTIGQELRQRSLYAIAFVLLGIVLYLAYAFRKVSHPVQSWKFGVVAIIALFHDVTILPGFFAMLGYFYGTEIDSLFITALLTLLGFSVHDTIVTLDRIRENLFTRHDLTFEQLVNLSINQTISRSINTSLTAIIAIASVYFFGGETVKNFSLALIIGIIVGTYSSIFIASPLLVTWYKISSKKV